VAVEAHLMVLTYIMVFWVVMLCNDVKQAMEACHSTTGGTQEGSL